MERVFISLQDYEASVKDVLARIMATMLLVTGMS